MDPRPLPDPPTYDVPGFCKAHRIARAHFYALLKTGRAPRIMKVGRRTVISGEAAAEWRARMEAAAEETSATASAGNGK